MQPSEQLPQKSPTEGTPSLSAASLHKGNNLFHGVLVRIHTPRISVSAEPLPGWEAYHLDERSNKLVIPTCTPSPLFRRTALVPFLGEAEKRAVPAKSMRAIRNSIYNASVGEISKFEQRTFASTEGTFLQPEFGIFPETDKSIEIMVHKGVNLLDSLLEIPQDGDAIIHGIGGWNGEFLLVNKKGTVSIQTRNPILSALWRETESERDTESRLKEFAARVQKSGYCLEFCRMPYGTESTDYHDLYRKLKLHPGTLYIKDAYGGGGESIVRMRYADDGSVIFESTSPEAVLMDRKIDEATDEQRGQESVRIQNPDLVIPALLRSMRLPLIEAQIPYEPVDGCRAEFRLICAVTEGKGWRVAAHYTKVSDNLVTANISHGGRGEKVESVVERLYRARLPELPAEDIQIRTAAFLKRLNESTRIFAERFHDHFGNRTLPDIAIDICPSWNSERREIDLYLVEVNQSNYGIKGLISCDPESAKVVTSIRIAERQVAPLFSDRGTVSFLPMRHEALGKVDAYGGKTPSDPMLLTVLPASIKATSSGNEIRTNPCTLVTPATPPERADHILDRFELAMREGGSEGISRNLVFKMIKQHGWLRVPNLTVVEVDGARTPALVDYKSVSSRVEFIEKGIEHLRKGGTVFIGVPYNGASFKVQDDRLEVDCEDDDVWSSWCTAERRSSFWPAQFMAVAADYFNNPRNIRNVAVCNGSPAEATLTDLRECVLLTRLIQHHQSALLVRGIYDFGDGNSFRIKAGKGPLNERLEMSMHLRTKLQSRLDEAQSVRPVGFGKATTLRESERAVLASNPILIQGLMNIGKCLVQESVEATNIQGVEYRFEVVFSHKRKVEDVVVAVRAADTSDPFVRVGDVEGTVENIYISMLGAILTEGECVKLARKCLREVRRESEELMRWCHARQRRLGLRAERFSGLQLDFRSLRVLGSWDLVRSQLGFVLDDLVPARAEEVSAFFDEGRQQWRRQWLPQEKYAIKSMIR